MGAVRIDLPPIVGGGYGEFWRCRERYRVVKGGKASKKSATAALWFIVHLMQHPQANLLVVRGTYASLRDSCFAQLKWAARRLGVEELWKAVESPLEMRYLPTGQRILFRGFDNVDKLASTTVETGCLCWVWVEEAFEIASEEDFNKLDLSVPRGAVKPPLFKQTTLTFNPWSGKHWLKKRFFDGPRPDVACFTTDYRCNEFLDETDRRLYERMREENPRRYAVAGLGQWGAAEGLVFENWRVETFDPGALPAECRRIYGLDYGYTNDPTAFIAAAVDPGRRELYIFDEHYERRMLNSDIAAMLRRKGVAKERIRADSAEPKSNEELRRLGIARVIPAVKGPDSVRSGIAAIQEYRITVHPRCIHTAAELGTYVWARNAGGEGINRPEDRDNHLMDALRYAMLDARRGGGEATMEVGYGRPTGVLPEDMTGGWG